MKCVEFAAIITYHYVTLVTYGLPVSKIETTSLNCEEAIKKPLISQRLIIRLHILNALVTFSADIHFIVYMYFSSRCVGFFLFHHLSLLFNFPYCFLVQVARLNYRHQLNVVFSDITPRHFVGNIWYRAIG